MFGKAMLGGHKTIYRASAAVAFDSSLEPEHKVKIPHPRVRVDQTVGAKAALSCPRYAIGRST